MMTLIVVLWKIAFCAICWQASLVESLSLRSNVRFPLKVFRTRVATHLAATPAVTIATQRQERYFQISVLATTIAAIELASSISNPAISPFLGSIFPAYSAAAISALTLSDAASRNRLDGNTFKLLNSGLLLGAIQTFSATIQIFMAVYKSQNKLKSVFGLLCLIHAYLTADIAYSSIISFGVPIFKFNRTNSLSTSYQFLAISNFFLPPQLVSCSFLITGIFWALNTAASAGEKRLSSRTYKILNSGIISLTLGKIYGLLPFLLSKSSPATILRNIFVFFYPVLTLITASVGLQKGLSYRE